MENLENFVNERLSSVKSDIVAGAFPTTEELEKEINRLNNILLSKAVLNGINKEQAQNYLREYFAPQIRSYYSENQALKMKNSKPEDYHFANIENKIEELIANKDFEGAKAEINNVLDLIDDEEIRKDAIEAGEFTEQDIKYFKGVLPNFYEKMKVEELPKMGFIERLKKGISFVFAEKNPYDNQQTSIKTESSFLDNLKNGRLMEWCRNNKVMLTVAGAAMLVGGAFLSKHYLHSKADAFPGIVNTENENQSPIKMATFEVDEAHNFNVNDEQTHIEKLQLLAKAFMERGVRVVSEEECMELSAKGILAVSPEQLDNWYISINLEDMNDLTFTKLLADSYTDKEELKSDFLHVNMVLGEIYTTKEETPFIFEFIANKEYSNHIKIYEEAIIQNQQGNKNDLIELIKSRVYNPVSETSNGPIGVLTSKLVKEQANVYNAQVIGQEIMDLYNIDNACETYKTTFFSDDFEEYMMKVDSKFASALAYTGSEKEAYLDYLKTLTDEQDDNKVFIEKQVLPYLELNNVQLGEWDEISFIVNNINTNGSAPKQKNNTSSSSTQTKTTTVPKTPTTPEEKAVQKNQEAENARRDQQSFENVIHNYAKQNGGKVAEDTNNNFIISIPGKQDITVDQSTLGAYNPNKDLASGTWYSDVADPKDAYQDYKNEIGKNGTSHLTNTTGNVKIENVQGVGTVVVTDEKDLHITNPNVYENRNGEVIDKKTGNKVIIGTSEELDRYIKYHPSITDEHIVDQGNIHYSGGGEDNLDSYNQQINDAINSAPNIPPTTETPVEDNNQNEQPPVDTPPSFDDVNLDNLTPEERKELEDILNAGNGPVAGEILDEVYSDVVYENYTVTQLMSNPSLCLNIPDSVLQTYPEIWQKYQAWLQEQKASKEASSQSETEGQPVEQAETQPVSQTEETAQSSLEDVSTQIEQLEAEKEKLTTSTASTNIDSKVKILSA